MKKMVKITAVSAAVILAGFAAVTGISKLTADNTVAAGTAEATATEAIVTTEATTEAVAVSMDMKADIAAGIGRATVQSAQTKTEDTTEDNADMEQPVAVAAQTNTSPTGNSNTPTTNSTTPVTNNTASQAPVTNNNANVPATIPATTEAQAPVCQHNWITITDTEAYDEPIYEEQPIYDCIAYFADGTYTTGDDTCNCIWNLEWCEQHCVTCFPDCPDPLPEKGCAFYRATYEHQVIGYETVQVGTKHHDAVTHQECNKCGAHK